MPEAGMPLAGRGADRRHAAEPAPEGLLNAVTANAFRVFAFERFGDAEVRRVCRDVPADYVREFFRFAPGGAMVPEIAFTSVMLALTKAHSIPAQKLMFEFGQFFLWYLADHAGIGKSIHRVTGDFITFTQCFTSMMLQLYTTAGNLYSRLPQLLVQNVTDTTLELLVFGTAPGTRTPAMMGMLQQAAQHVFGLNITIETLKELDSSRQCQTMLVRSATPFTANADELSTSAHEKQAREQEKQAQQRQKRDEAEQQCCQAQEQQVQRRNDQAAQQEQLEQGEQAHMSAALARIVGLDPETLFELMPFHLVMNQQFQLLQAGSGISRVVPELATQGVQVDEQLTIVFPSLRWDSRMVDLLLQQATTSRVMLRSRSGLVLKGGLYRVRLMQRALDNSLEQGEEVLLFLGAPLCLTIEEMERHKLFLVDLPAHDMSADFVLMSNHRHVKSLDLEHTAARLMQEQQSNTALKATLAETLAAQEAVAGRPGLNTNSAVDLTIGLLNRLVLGEDVDVQQVLYVRDALLRAGVNLWQPVDFDATAIAADQEVNEALGELLGAMPAKPEFAESSQAPHMKGAYEATSSTSLRFTGTTSGHPSSNLPSTGSQATPPRPRPPLEKSTSVDSPKLMRLINTSSSGAAAPGAAGGGVSKRALPKQRSISLALHTGKPYAAIARIRRVSALMAEAAARTRSAAPKLPPPLPGITKQLSSQQSQLAQQQSTGTATRPSIQTRSMEAAKRRQPSVGGQADALGSRSIIRRVGATPSATDKGLREGGGQSKDEDKLRCLLSKESTLQLVVMSGVSVTGTSALQQPQKAKSALEAPTPAETTNSEGHGLALLPASPPIADNASSAAPALHKLAEAPATLRFLRWHKSLSQRPASVSDSTGASSPQSPTGGLSSFVNKLKQKFKMRFSSAKWRRELFTRSSSSPNSTEEDVPTLKRQLTAPARQVSAMTIAAKAHPIKLVLASSGSAGAGAGPIVPHDTRMKVLFEPTDELAAALRGVDEWQYDSFQLDRASGGHALSCLAYHLMKRTQLIKQLHLSETRLVRFLMRIEQGYKNNPYHSAIHAADVLRTLHVVLTRGGVLDTIVAAGMDTAGQQQQAGENQAATPPLAAGQANASEVDLTGPTKLLSCYLAAVIHDFEHGGVNNDFLVKSSDPLAVLYNDASPLENHHVSAAFMLMRDEHFAFFPGASKRMQDVVRKNTIELVLSTDMKQHFATIGVFNSKLMHERREQELRFVRPSVREPAAGGAGHIPGAPAGVDGGGRTSTTRRVPLANPVWDTEMRMLVLKMALKCADLGHLASSLAVHKQWVSRLEEEMYLQGDQERALGQPVSPLMDRTKGGVTKSQVGFFAVVALPMFSSFAQVFPGTEPLHSNVLANRHYWAAVEEANGSRDGST